MMPTALTTSLLLANAERHHGHTEIVSRLPSGHVHRHTFADFARRTRQLMNALDTLGVPAGAVVATLAWNDYRHLEAYFAVPTSGRVLHTLNVRLPAQDLDFVMNDASDSVVLVDRDFLPVLAEVLPRVPSVRHVIVLDSALHPGDPQGALAYEDVLAGEPSTYDPPVLDEHAAAGLCYTSGTTGRPKGVVSTHRSIFLHALAVSSGAGMSVGPQDCVLPQVPMFHAWAWGLPYTCIAVGAKVVLYAGPLDHAPFVDLLVQERVTIAAGVPTVWIGLADEVASRGASWETLRHVVCGGSQPPPTLIDRYRRDFGISIVQAWGMTETSPLASIAWPQERMRDWSDDRIDAAARRQAGLPLPGVEVDIRNDDGAPVPFDGETMGSLHVRGPWVTDGYLHGVGAESFSPDGWFVTGDVAIGSADGYFVITDRTKDLIKSGGEWISSVELEAAIMAMPEVAEAAVIAVPNSTWLERPFAFVVPSTGSSVDVDAVRSHLLDRGFARWQLPDAVEIITEIPKTAVGKFDKKQLRSLGAG